MSDFGDFLILCIALVGITWGIAERVYNNPVHIERRVEVCSPRSIDSYPPIELRRIAAARERMERVRAK